MTPPVVLCTDFGMSDWYAGTMKGVIASVNPAAPVIDLTHDIPPQDIRAAAFSLMVSYCFFPEKTVFCVVVDPGVGTARRPVIADSGRYRFVAPDNGVLSYVCGKEAPVSWYRITNPDIMLPETSTTFHGRDIFAPVAAHLLSGFDPAEAGPCIDDPVTMPFPRARESNGSLCGTIVYFDRFGNALTSISSQQLSSTNTCTVTAGTHTVPLGSCFGDAPAQKPCAYRGSSGYLEIAINRGNARKSLCLQVGDAVTVTRQP